MDPKHGAYVPPAEVDDEKRDALRMLFYLSLPAYREVRYLRGKLNAYGYLAVVLSAERLILDTERKGNAIRVLNGAPFNELLQIAMGTKRDIDASGRSRVSFMPKAGRTRCASS